MTIPVPVPVPGPVEPPDGQTPTLRHMACFEGLRPDKEHLPDSPACLFVSPTRYHPRAGAKRSSNHRKKKGTKLKSKVIVIVPGKGRKERRKTPKRCGNDRRGTSPRKHPGHHQQPPSTSTPEVSPPTPKSSNHPTPSPSTPNPASGTDSSANTSSTHCSYR